LGSVLSLIFAAILAYIMTLFAMNRWNSIETTIDLRLPLSYLMAVVAACFWLAFFASIVGLWREITQRRA